MRVQMQHTEETIQRLSRVQYRTYCTLQRLMTVLTACVLLALGTVGPFNRATSLMLIALGCWTMMSLDVPADRNAKKLIKSAKGRMPASVFTFSEDAVTIAGEGEQTVVKYDAFYSLICDGAYLYLFRNRYSAYMVPLDAVESGSGEELKRFLAEKTGLTVQKPGSLLRIRFQDLKK